MRGVGRGWGGGPPRKVGLLKCLKKKGVLIILVLDGRVGIK